MRTNKTIFLIVGFLILLSITVGCAWGWYHERKESEKLKQQIIGLQAEQKRSAITSSVSHQLGEIAAEQQQIAEQQKSDALYQKKVAESARQAAEEAEFQAKKERENAEMQRKKAEEERENADKERKIAEDERAKAQYSERQADTLRYVALGRSLGAASLQLQSANAELSKLLAYYAYYYTDKYGGNSHFPAIFQSLMAASQGKHEWNKHRGMVSGIDFLADGRLVSISNYGEMFLHKKNGSSLSTEVLVNDKSLDFRYVYASTNNNVYAVSKTGKLVVVSWPNQHLSVRVFQTQIEEPFFCYVVDEQHVLVTGPSQLASIDLSETDPSNVQVRPYAFKAVSAAVVNGTFCLYDDHNHLYHIKDFNQVIRQGKLGISGTITCSSFSNEYHLKVYGTANGKIYLYKDGVKDPIELVGHKSRVTKMRFSANRLITTSYDGRVLSWDVSNEKIEPMDVVVHDAWLLCITRDINEQNVWLGDQDGSIIEVLMSPSTMKDIIENELKHKKRDLTLKEWNDYIGQHEPYQPVIVHNRKEGTQ